MRGRRFRCQLSHLFGVERRIAGIHSANELVDRLRGLRLHLRILIDGALDVGGSSDLPLNSLECGRALLGTRLRSHNGRRQRRTALTASIVGTQASAQQRSTAFQAVQGQIGTATDIKGSIDQNSQVQTQTAQTINELVGAVNAGNAALNAEQMRQLAAEAASAQFMTYDASKLSFVGQ